MNTQKLTDSIGWIRLVCLGMAFLTRIFVLSPYEILHLFLVSACTGILCVLLREAGGWKKYGGLALTVLLAVPRHSIASLITLAVLLGVCVLRTWKGEWTFRREAVEKTLYRGALVYAVFALIMVMNENAWDASISFLIAFGTCSVFVLRLRRGERIAEDKYVWLNLAVCGILTLVLLAICTPFFRTILMQCALLAARYIVLPAMWVLAMSVTLVMTVIFYILSPLLNLLGVPGEAPGLDFQVMDLSEMTGESEIPESVPPVPEIVWFAALTLAAALLVWLVIRRLKKNADEYTARGTIERMDIRTLTPDQKKQRTPLAGIRALYVRYLRSMKKAGLDIDPADTSLKTAVHADAILQKPWGKQLRQLWLPVRYGRQEEASMKDAKELYKKIRRRQKEIG